MGKTSRTSPSAPSPPTRRSSCSSPPHLLLRRESSGFGASKMGCSTMTRSARMTLNTRRRAHGVSTAKRRRPLTAPWGGRCCPLWQAQAMRSQSSTMPAAASRASLPCRSGPPPPTRLPSLPELTSGRRPESDRDATA